MSLDKAIAYKKEKRKPYRGSKAFDRSCRNHGSCPYCQNNRVFSGKRQAIDYDTGDYYLRGDIINSCVCAR